MSKQNSEKVIKELRAQLEAAKKEKSAAERAHRNELYEARREIGAQRGEIGDLRQALADQEARHANELLQLTFQNFFQQIRFN